MLYLLNQSYSCEMSKTEINNNIMILYNLNGQTDIIKKEIDIVEKKLS